MLLVYGTFYFWNHQECVLIESMDYTYSEHAIFFEANQQFFVVDKSTWRHADVQQCLVYFQTWSKLCLDQIHGLKVSYEGTQAAGNFLEKL